MQILAPETNLALLDIFLFVFITISEMAVAVVLLSREIELGEASNRHR
jgi:hypothetical protein